MPKGVPGKRKPYRIESEAKFDKGKQSELKDISRKQWLDMKHGEESYLYRQKIMELEQCKTKKFKEILQKELDDLSASLDKLRFEMSLVSKSIAATAKSKRTLTDEQRSKFKKELDIVSNIIKPNNDGRYTSNKKFTEIESLVSYLKKVRKNCLKMRVYVSQESERKREEISFCEDEQSKIVLQDELDKLLTELSGRNSDISKLESDIKELR